jgi:hypothetical protein
MAYWYVVGPTSLSRVEDERDRLAQVALRPFVAHTYIHTYIPSPSRFCWSSPEGQHVCVFLYLFWDICIESRESATYRIILISSGIFASRAALPCWAVGGFAVRSTVVSFGSLHIELGKSAALMLLPDKSMLSSVTQSPTDSERPSSLLPVSLSVL